MTARQIAMWPYYPELLDKPVPRYTSYPTAADFDEVSSDAYRTALERAEGDISLYVHIPFCEKICFYCGCNTGAAGRRQRLESYLAALHAEIASVSELLPADSRVTRIAFGGGSPNAIRPTDFLELVNGLDQQFNLSDLAFSIELDPRTMTAEWGDAIAEVGIANASLGVQTFARHCQTAIGREQADPLICRSIDWLRSAGVTSLNFDLMYGLPGQTRADLEDTLEYTALLGADRVALFGYAHVPHLVARQKMIDASALPDRRERFAMAALGHAKLTGSGYEQIGFDHFALPQDPLACAAREGGLRRNFQGFTDDQADVLIGLGSSAISSFPELLVQNEKNSGRYRMLASQGMLTASRGVHRTSEDRMRGDAIEQLLCHGEVELPPCLHAALANQLAAFVERRLVTLDDLHLRITPLGLPYARTIAALFDTYRDTSQPRFSSAI